MSHIVHIVLNDFVNDSRVLKAGSLMVDQGHIVTILCLKTDRTLEEEVVQGMNVKRLTLSLDSWPRIFNPFKFLEFLARVQPFIKDADLVHVNDFEPLPIVYWAKLKGRKFKLLYDAHEFASEKNGLGKWSRWFIKATEKFLVKKADVVITVSEGIAQQYVKLYKRKQVPVILNVPPAFGEVEKTNILRETFGISEDKTIFLYQGKFLIDRGIPQLIKAFEDVDERAVLVFMGSGTLEAEVKQAAESLSNVFFKSAVPYSELLSYTSSADYGLLTTEDVCLNHYYCMPNKLFEYIQAGIPVISTDLHDCKKVILGEKLGLIMDAATAEGYRVTINDAVDRSVVEFKQGLELSKKKYNWEVEQKKLLKIYQELLAVNE